MITDKAVRAAIQGLSHSGAKRVELRDPNERGGGRLLLVARQSATHVIAEWYATWQRNKKRYQAKLGTYPTMTVAEARKEFRQRYTPAILKGENPIGPRATNAAGRGTVKELFEAYVAYLGNRPHAEGARQMLLGKNGAANSIGPNRPAAAVRKQHVIPHLAAIHQRGSKTQANYVRNCLHAAFGYGIRNANSFFDVMSATDWGLEFNPITVIPTNPDAGRARDRNLSEDEFRRLWTWLGATRTRNRGLIALKLMMATGQRPGEILQLSVDHYDRDCQALFWRKTKNGRPHSIPLPQVAIELLNSLTPNEFGLYFPARDDKAAPAAVPATARLVRRHIEQTGVAPFEARDLRRTWKTLAGRAGLSKEMRDRLQNHALQDVSGKHYDRWSYVPEKTAAMKQWGEYLDKLLAKPAAVTTSSAPATLALPSDRISRLGEVMGAEAWRAAPQARHYRRWVGNAVAEAFELPKPKSRDETVATLIQALVAAGIIHYLYERDPARRVSVPVYRWGGATGPVRQKVCLSDAIALDTVPAVERPARLRRAAVRAPFQHELWPT